MNCPGSINLTNSLGDNARKAGQAAAEGSAAHELAADCLMDGSDAWEHSGKVIEIDSYSFTVDAEMVEHVQGYLNFVRNLVAAYEGAQMLVEHSMSSIFDEDAYGTGDVVILVPGILYESGEPQVDGGGRLIIIDLKYGRGVTVEPDSVQNKYYGALALEDFEAEEVDLWIYQPRIPHPRGVARRHPTSRTELEEWFQNEVLPAMSATRDPDALLKMGTWCQFCPAQGACPVVRTEITDFPTEVQPETLTNEDLGALLVKGRAIVKCLPTLESEAYNRAFAGEKIPGSKLVKATVYRQWKDDAEEAILEAYGEDAYEKPKLKTPPVIEKLKGGKKFVKEWAHQPPTNKLTLVKESDKKKEYVPLMDKAGPPEATS
jgi:hypothetical protein